MAFGPEDVVLGAAPFSHVLGLVTGALDAIARRLDRRRAAIRRRGNPGTDDRDADDDPARRPDDVHRALRGGPLGAVAAARPDRARRRRSRTERDRRRLRANVRRQARRGLRPHRDVRDRDDVHGRGPAKSGSVGTPLGETELRIADPADERGVGEVEFRGPSVVPGYWNDRGRRPRRSPPTAGSRPAISAASTPTATSSSSTARRSSDPRRLQRLPARGRGGAVRPSRRARGGGRRRATRPARRGSRGARRPQAGCGCGRRRAESMDEAACRRIQVPAHRAFADELPKGPTGKILKRAIDRGSLT